MALRPGKRGSIRKPDRREEGKDGAFEKKEERATVEKEGKEEIVT
jgi:hypothetical protein